jgi:hypothetical protein
MPVLGDAMLALFHVSNVTESRSSIFGVRKIMQKSKT